MQPVYEPARSKQTLISNPNTKKTNIYINKKNNTDQLLSSYMLAWSKLWVTKKRDHASATFKHPNSFCQTTDWAYRSICAYPIWKKQHIACYFIGINLIVMLKSTLVPNSSERKRRH